MVLPRDTVHRQEVVMDLGGHLRNNKDMMPMGLLHQLENTDHIILMIRPVAYLELNHLLLYQV